jgi:DNA end-binding protein Ku
MAPRAIATASLSFGLVTIPVKLYSTARREAKVGFHWLHAACGTRVNMKWYCSKHDKIVERAELVRGYEVSKGRYAPVEEEELAETKEESRDDIGIAEFVPAGTLGPLYYEHGYYLAPDRHGDKAYAILARALEDDGRVAIGRYAARGDLHVVAIQAQDGVLVMLQLRYADEVRAPDEIDVPSARVSERELDLAEQLIRQHASDAFDPTKYKDEVRLRKLRLIEGKVKAGEVEVEAEAERPGKGKAAEAVDLMAALEASLAGAGRARGHAAPTARKAPRASRPHRTRSARPARPARSAKPARAARASRRSAGHAAKSH